MIEIHPNMKLLTVADFALHPVLKAFNNAWYFDEYSNITTVLGCNRGVGLIGSDDEAAMLRLIHTKAGEIAAEWDGLEDNEMPPQLRDGIERGKKSHPRGKVVGVAVRTVVDEVKEAVTRIDLPLTQQPGADIDKVTAEAIEKHVKPLTDVKKNNKVVIIIRRTKSTPGCAVDKELFEESEFEETKSKFGVPVKQLTHCLAAGRNYKYIDGEGLTRSYIDDETELIILFADDTDRKQLYTELIETAMAHINDGDVLAVISINNNSN